ITLRLLLPDEDSAAARRQASERFLPAMLTILAADATMSLDNVLAVAALAAGNIPLLVGGLIFSMTLLFIASSIVARLIERATWLLDVAAGVLAWTAANLMLEDKVLQRYVSLTEQQQMMVRLGAVFFILLIDLGLRLWRRRVARKATPPGMQQEHQSNG